MSVHGTCTAVFVVVAAIIAFTLGSIQTLHEVSWLAWVGASPIVISSKFTPSLPILRSGPSYMRPDFTMTRAVGVQDKPADARPGPFRSDWKAKNDHSFTSAISACSSIIFAWAGTPAFFQIASEMREPHLYTRAMVLCQAVMAVVYIVIWCCGILLLWQLCSFPSTWLSR